MKLRNSIAGVLVAAAALVPTITPAPATAQTQTFTDTGETPDGYGGIARVKVTYGARALSIRIVTGPDGLSDHFHVYLDTAGHGYPEWFRCIGRPPRVRVNVESVFETGTVFDRLPTRYHWTPWVRRG